MTAFMVGWILVHSAFVPIMEEFPERRDPTVSGYVAVDDCGAMGDHLVLVRSGHPDVLLAVADCANPLDVAFRRSMGYIADVDETIWRGAWAPQRAELWTPKARARYWQRMERLT